MRKYLLPEDGKFYKANLHSHSTVSDGLWTPEEMKSEYIKEGYSIIAYTDHNLMVTHNELTDDNFLALNGIEFGVNNIVDNKPSYKMRKNCDICMIALKPDNDIQPCWDKGTVVPDEYKSLVKFDETKPNFKMEYKPEVINAMILEGKKCGFFVTHNHPMWSREEYTDYIQYENMDAMEIYNHGSACSGHDEHNAKIYDEQLRKGKRLYCIATDDNHNKSGRVSDSFGGFTMIKSKELKYEAITEALVNGNFYASEGPIINELYFEDGKVFITTEPAKEIYITKCGKNLGKVQADKELVTSACFNIDSDDEYFFITVVGADGKKAYTNAYYPIDLF